VVADEVALDETQHAFEIPIVAERLVLRKFLGERVHTDRAEPRQYTILVRKRIERHPQMLFVRQGHQKVVNQDF